MTFNYRLGTDEVEARQHDGTDDSATALAEWIHQVKGKVEVLPKGTYDYDLHNAYLLLLNKFDSIVAPNTWIVKTVDNHFYAVYPDVFKSMYRVLGGDDAEIHQENTDDRSL